MSRRFITTLFVVGALALAAMIVAVVGITNQDSSSGATVNSATSPASQFEGALLPPGVRAPNFALRDQDGKRVTMKEYRGRVVVVTFLYSHCKTECPVQAQQIKGALDDIGKPVPVLSVSVDPPGDTPK